MSDKKMQTDGRTGMINISQILDLADLEDKTELKAAGFLTGANYGFFVSTQSPEVMKELVVTFLLVAGGIRASSGQLEKVNKTPYMSVAGLAVGLAIGIGLSRPEVITEYLA